MTDKSKSRKEQADFDITKVPPPPGGLTDEQIKEYFGFHSENGNLATIKTASKMQIKQPTFAGNFKVKFYREVTGALLEHLTSTVARADVDFIEKTIKVDLRDSADGSVMEDFLSAYGTSATRNANTQIGLIEIKTNPDRRDSPVVQYSIDRIIDHKLSFDYAANETLMHKLVFSFRSFRLSRETSA